MIIEDLLWRDDVKSSGLPSGYGGALRGSDVLSDCEVVDIRIYPPLRSAGIIFNGNGLIALSPLGHLLNVAVLIVRNVQSFECPRIRDYIESWQIDTDAQRWACQFSQVHVPGVIDIQGIGASLYFGKALDVPRVQPNLSEHNSMAIRAGWPSWSSTFELTIEPEHANPDIIDGYVHRILSTESNVSIDGQWFE
jgi:hypothetical protein